MMKLSSKHYIFLRKFRNLQIFKHRIVMPFQGFEIIGNLIV